MTARNVGTDIIVSPFTARSGTAHAALKVNGYRGPSTQIDAIQRHYDRLSAFYRTFWGDHIHHGLWEGARNAKEAQVALIERLTAKADIRPGSHVLDVGCGLGGSSIWLARNLKCTVLGLTISPVQLKLQHAVPAAMGCPAGCSFDCKMRMTSRTKMSSTAFGSSNVRSTCSIKPASLAMPPLRCGLGECLPYARGSGLTVHSAIPVVI